LRWLKFDASRNHWQILSLRKTPATTSRDKGVSTQRKSGTMCCCQIPPYDFRSDRTRSAGDGGIVVRAWASLLAGAVLLSASLASAIWLAVRLT
jgi:hypothetical protein